jgi:hypothetical protein
MRITIDIPDELWALVRRLVRPESPGPRPHRPGPDPDDEPADVQRDPPPRPGPHRQDDQPGLEPQRTRRPESGGNGNGNRKRNDPPKTGPQLAGWAYKQPKAISDRAKKIANDHDLGRLKDLSDDDAQWVYHELTKGQYGGAPAASNGYGGGR